MKQYARANVPNNERYFLKQQFVNFISPPKQLKVSIATAVWNYAYVRIGRVGDINFRIAAEYFSIFQLFSQPGFNAMYFPEVLVNMRVGVASRRLLTNIIRKSHQDYVALRRSNFVLTPAFMVLSMKNFSKVGQFLGKH